MRKVTLVVLLGVLAACSQATQGGTPTTGASGGGEEKAAAAKPEARQINLTGGGRLTFSRRPQDQVQQLTLNLRSDGLFDMKALGSIAYDMSGRWSGTQGDPTIRLEARDGFDGSLTDARGTLIMPESGVAELQMEGTAYGGRFRLEFNGREMK